MLVATVVSAPVVPASGGLFGPAIPVPEPESAAPEPGDEDSLTADDQVPPREAERRAAEAAARERATTDRTVPRAETFYPKNLEYPVYRNRFATHAPREQFIEIEGRDSDLMERHRGINRLYYEVVVCPKCSFAAFAEDFARLVTGEDEAVTLANAPLHARVASLDFLGFRDARLAQSAFELAIVAYGQRRSSPRKVASLNHRLAWLARQAGNAAREKRFLDTALKGYMAALKKLSAYDQRLELTITYLVAELSRRVDDLPVAMKWVSQLLQGPQLAAPGARMIADLARDLRQNLRPAAPSPGR